MALSDKDVQDQIDQMVAFIHQEAEEKATEISMKAQDEFIIQKGNIVQYEKVKIISEYERKQNQVEVEKRIAYSNEVNQARLKILKLRNDLVEEVFAAARRKLATLTQDPAKYQELLQQLLLEGFIKLMEPKVTVLCREQDVALVEAAIPKAIAEYKTKLKGRACEAKVNKKHFLPGPPDPQNPEHESCYGGVVLSVGKNGRTIISNTLDQRLDLAIQETLPQVRAAVFGKAR